MRYVKYQLDISLNVTKHINQFTAQSQSLSRRNLALIRTSV